MKILRRERFKQHNKLFFVSTIVLDELYSSYVNELTGISVTSTDA